MSKNFKSHFHFDPGVTYLNASYVSPMPVASAQAGVDAIAKRTNSFHELTAQDFFDTSEKLRAATASLWGTVPHNVALVPSVSYGVETAVGNIFLKAGAEILVPQDDFPSDIYPWSAAAKRSGANVSFVPRPADFDWTSAFLARISSRTAVVSVPLSDWSDGTKFDLVKLSRACKDIGACFVVDVSQSFGAVPFSIADFDPDFMFSVGYKWQLGPYGLAYLYVSDRWLGGTPLENNWITRKGSEDFSRINEYRDEFQDGARRFDAGQRSQFHLTPMALESMRLLKELSITSIFSHTGALVRDLHERLLTLGFVLPAPEHLAGHMLGARHRNHPEMTTLVKRLKEHGVFVSARGSAVRISPHLYNDAADIEKLLRALASVTS